MTRFAASQLDLSNLPAPEVVKNLSYEAILSARLARLAERLSAAGVGWDVGALETDPIAISEQEDAFRELLDLAAINDAAKSVMLAFAIGGDLDQLAADYGIARRLIRPATADTAAVAETDRELRRRVQLAPEAFTTAGSAGAFAHHAMEASSAVVDVGLVIPSLGRVDVILLDRVSDEGVSTDARLAVRERLLRKDVKPLTAEVTVRSATRLAYRIELRLLVQNGPDPAVIRAAAQRAIVAMLADRRRIGAATPRSAIFAAAHVAGVERVELVEPVSDVEPKDDEIASCSEIVVSSEIVDD
ncbi:baseplate J/gp47 family protein [Methylopila sp. M107]|uniref:baseplate assembly protein n=1 Tax=Methylopila sp. M107 TaxID=1101190 RepID=UPI00036C91CE|nr:baseplate J/gp47 family protein [Methylopila sp. M107]